MRMLPAPRTTLLAVVSAMLLVATPARADDLQEAAKLLRAGQHAQAMERVDALASLMVNTYGVKKGDRVAVAMRNFPEWIISFAAIISVGAVNVSFNAWWTEDEMKFALEDCGAKVLIGDQQRIDTAHHVARAMGVKMLIVRPETEVGPDIDEWSKVVKSGLGALVADIQPDLDRRRPGQYR